MNPKVKIGLRILFGVFALIFGINKFAAFLPAFEIPGDGGTLFGIYESSGFMKIIGVIEILGGLALLAGKFVPMALVWLTAIMFNALLFHLLHDKAGIGGAALGMILSLLLVFSYKDSMKCLFKS